MEIFAELAYICSQIKMKQRLDILMVERGLVGSREQAQGHILAGNVFSENHRLEKAGMSYPADIPLEIRGSLSKFVSRAGEKLEQALDHFKVSPQGRIALDIGASTGGFTDCLLQSGARHVFAVDVGYGQIDSRLRDETRVTVLEKCNARYLTLGQLMDTGGPATEISLVTADVSFISLNKVIAPLVVEFPRVVDWVLLFKPQFEVGPENLRKGGVVKDEETGLRAIDEFQHFAAELGLLPRGCVRTILTGKKSGNFEYLLHYEKISS